MILQPIVDIAEICALKGIADVVASPGSRCAPITLAFTRHPKMKVRSISDERSAAFTAMGMAQQENKTVGLVCTSGSAAYNYAPGIAEAFYQQIPLLVLTADRPPEWIDQYDGQTIHQSGIYGAHVKKSYELPVDYSHDDAKWQINRILNEAINLANQEPYGPVHINVPIRAPFYPESGESIRYAESIRLINKHKSEKHLEAAVLSRLEKRLSDFNKILVVAGQENKNEALTNALNEFSNKFNCPIISDIIANLHGCEHVIRHQDAFLGAVSEKVTHDLIPELLITFGKSVISKHLKIFLRKNKAIHHWHLQSHDRLADSFQSLTDVYEVDPAYFFNVLGKGKGQSKVAYLNHWKLLDDKFQNFKAAAFGDELFNEFAVVNEVMSQLPDNASLHLANSMTVRYANFIGLHNPSIEVFGNRGTSGIDGSVSTAVGAALKSDKPVVLLIGDMAFFYDRNAFWQQSLPENLTIVLLNNHAGGIFGLIDGPDKLPELQTYFETEQLLDAQHLASEYGLSYNKVNAIGQIDNALNHCFEQGSGLCIVEIETSKEVNKEFYTTFKQEMTRLYGSIS